MSTEKKRADIERRSQILNEQLAVVLREEAELRGLTFEARGAPLPTDTDESPGRPPFFVGGVGPFQLVVEASDEWGDVGATRDEEFVVVLEWPTSPEPPDPEAAPRVNLTPLDGHTVEELRAAVREALDGLFPSTAPPPSP